MSKWQPIETAPMEKWKQDIIDETERRITYIKTRILFNGHKTILSRFFSWCWNRRLRKWEALRDQIKEKYND